MDEIRRFRLLITPFVYVSWLLVGISIRNVPGQWDWLFRLIGEKGERAGALVTLAIAVTIPFGYFLNTGSLWLAHCFFSLIGLHEEALPSLYGNRRRGSPVWGAIRVEFDRVRTLKNHQMFATAALAYGVADGAIGDWISRRWATFNIGINAAFTLLTARLTWAIGFNVNAPPLWPCLTYLLAILSVCSAVKAWKETMGMLEFQSRRSEGLVTKRGAR